MESMNFWNSVTKRGAILGAILAVSFMLEVKLMLTSHFAIYFVEWLVVVCLHFYLLMRYTRRYSSGFSDEEGFSFGKGYGYIVVLSVIAGIWVGVVQYLYLHFFIGYANYTERMIAALNQGLADNGGVPASLEPTMMKLFDQIQNTAEPSFFSTVWSGTFSGLLFGAIFGLIIAGIVARRPRPFDTQAN